MSAVRLRRAAAGFCDTILKSSSTVRSPIACVRRRCPAVLRPLTAISDALTPIDAASVRTSPAMYCSRAREPSTSTSGLALNATFVDNCIFEVLLVSTPAGISGIAHPSPAPSGPRSPVPVYPGGQAPHSLLPTVLMHSVILSQLPLVSCVEAHSSKSTHVDESGANGCKPGSHAEHTAQPVTAQYVMYGHGLHLTPSSENFPRSHGAQMPSSGLFCTSLPGSQNA